MRYLVLSIFIFINGITAFAQSNCDPKDFELLKAASKKKALNEKEFRFYLSTVKKLESQNCYDYVEKQNGQEYVETGLTHLFGKVCLRANSPNAVKEYVSYLYRQAGSAEEERSYSFEYIFKQNPMRVLSIIGFNSELLDHLVWGFLNNRLYGEVDPYENDANKAFTRYDKEPERILTTKTYKNIFYKTYPTLVNNKLYQKEIEYLLNTIYAGIKELYE